MATMSYVLGIFGS